MPINLIITKRRNSWWGFWS